MKKRNIYIMIIIIVSLACIVGISIKILDNTGKINQGNFRVNDAVLTSTVYVEEKEVIQENTASEDENSNEEATENTTTETEVVEATDETNNEFNNLAFTLSQKNVLDLLITKEMKIEEMYISDIVTSSPSKKGDMYMTINDSEEKIDMFSNVDIYSKVDIIPEEKDDQYYIQIKINNDEFDKDVNLENEANKIKLDGTILSLLNIDIKDITFTVKFNLNIVDETGKLNVCKVNIKMPSEELVNDGISVTRQGLSNYVFSIRQNSENTY